MFHRDAASGTHQTTACLAYLAARGKMMKILIATDGSSQSELAARTLLALRPPTEAKITVLYVKRWPQPVLTPAVPPGYVQELHLAQQELQTEAEEVAEQAVAGIVALLKRSGLKADEMIAEGHPADQIVGVAKDIGADLTVVGSKGATGSTLFTMGSVSQKVQKYSSSSVLLTKPPDGTAPTTMRRILIATDGSDNANEAARFLTRFGLQEETEITLLSVVQQPGGISPLGSSPAIMEQLRKISFENAERLIEDTKKLLDTKARVGTELREGDPAEQILKAGSRMEADLIVVGSKGLSGIKRFLLGSVSERVCKYSETSVMLVKMPQTPNHSSEGRPEHAS